MAKEMYCMTLSPRLCAFLNNGVFDSRLNSNHGCWQIIARFNYEWSFVPVHTIVCVCQKPNFAKRAVWQQTLSADTNWLLQNTYF